MNKKAMLFALAIVSAAMFALPAGASAEVAHVSSTGKFTLSSEGNSAITEHGKTSIFPCTSVTGNGEFTTTTTGKLTLSFHGCTESAFKSSCTGESAAGTDNEPAGTITTTQLEFHLIELENNTPGVLLTPTTGHFATYTCLNGLSTKKITGNGVIGHITSTCGGAASTTHKIDFGTTNETVAGSTQQWTQVTTAGTKYDLLSNGSTAALDARLTIHFSDGVARSIICT